MVDRSGFYREHERSQLSAPESADPTAYVASREDRMGLGQKCVHYIKLLVGFGPYCGRIIWAARGLLLRFG